MDRNSRAVKPTRRYNSAGRRAQAARAGQTVLDAALRRFLADGYASTTVAAVAAEAGVSVETIYKTFGGKPGLVRAISQRQLAGDDPVPTETTSDRMRESVSDPRVIITNWGLLSVDVLPRLAPILLVVRSAAGADPEMAVLRKELEEQRETRMMVNARFLAEHGHLRDGLSVEHARDVMFACSSPELYELLVLRQGWSGAQFAAFVSRSMIAALIEPSAPAAADI